MTIESTITDAISSVPFGTVSAVALGIYATFKAINIYKGFENGRNR